MLTPALRNSFNRQLCNGTTLFGGWRRTSSAMATSSAQIAVLGGGLAGAYCANLLAEQGIRVTLFDMGRSGFGGRASTRRSGGYQFDHGCQFITPTADGTIRLLQNLQEAGVAQPWDGKFLGREMHNMGHEPPGSLEEDQQDFCSFRQGVLWVGVPGMGSICKHLAAAHGIQQRWNCKVDRVEQLPGRRWRVIGIQRSNESEATETVEEEADFLVLTDPMMALTDLPGSIAFNTLREQHILEKLREPKKVPTLSLMAVFERPLDSYPCDAIGLPDSRAFKFISCDSRKPGRQREDGKQCWVAISTPDFAEEVLASGARDAAALTPILQKEFLALLTREAGGAALPGLVFASAQRWGSAFKSGLLHERSLLDEENAMAACGDFCVQSSAEGALLSAADAAERVQKVLL